MRADLARDTIGASADRADDRAPARCRRSSRCPMPRCCSKSATGRSRFVPTSAMPHGRRADRRRAAGLLQPQRRALHGARAPRDPLCAGHRRHRSRATATPTDAEIAQAYQARRARHMRATEKRTHRRRSSCSIRPPPTRSPRRPRPARTLVARGRAAGLEASTLDRARQGGAAQRRPRPRFADAVFAAPRGRVVGPVRGGLGFVVARIDEVEQVAGQVRSRRSRGEIAAALTDAEDGGGARPLHDAIDDALGRQRDLRRARRRPEADRRRPRPPLLADRRRSRAARQARRSGARAARRSAASRCSEGDEPQMVPTGADGSFARGRARPRRRRRAAPAGADPRAGRRRDLTADRARVAARRIAGADPRRASTAARRSQRGVGEHRASKSAGPKPLAAQPRGHRTARRGRPARRWR